MDQKVSTTSVQQIWYDRAVELSNMGKSAEEVRLILAEEGLDEHSIGIVLQPAIRTPSRKFIWDMVIGGAILMVGFIVLMGGIPSWEGQSRYLTSYVIMGLGLKRFLKGASKW